MQRCYCFFSETAYSKKSRPQFTVPLHRRFMLEALTIKSRGLQRNQCAHYTGHTHTVVSTVGALVHRHSLSHT